MARDWRKFDFDELCFIWSGHKMRNPNIDPLRQNFRAEHKKIELTKEDIDDLVDCLLEKVIRARDCLEGKQ
jgi:hypothetical protein